jgi:undecaprenyl-diphosphooligosaccharide--protein glycosyltransferase
MSLFRKIRVILQSRLSIIRRLNDLSIVISHWTYQRSTSIAKLEQRSHIYSVFPALLGIVVAYGFMCHFSQEKEFKKGFESFLVNGEYVLTTNDSGHYMTLAKNYQSSKALRPPQIFPESLGAHSTNQSDSELVGRILPMMISSLSDALNISLERAGVFLTYGSVLSTAILVFIFFSILNQPFLGFVAAFSSVASWPIYTRMSIGMLDTDLLNLFFLFAILILFFYSIKAEQKRYVLLFSLVAGLLNFTFYLWYGKAGFTLPLLASLVLLCIAYGKSLRLSLMAGLVFLVGSGPEQIFRMFDSLQGFFGAYIWRYQPIVSGQEISTNYVNVIWESVSEVMPATLKVIDTWFGSKYLYFVGLFGWLLWILQDWRKLFLCLPFVVFAVLFHTSGLRFAFYSAPFIWVGIAITFIAFGRLLYSKFDPASQSLLSKSVVSICFVGALVFAGAGAPPWGEKPKPIIHGDEIAELQGFLKKRPNPKAVIVSWWDAGYLISYYTGLPTTLNEGSQTSLKTLYVARALVSSDPTYAADEIRYATYFSNSDLGKFFPKRPPPELAQGTDHDIYVFLPTNTELKMLGVGKVAAAGQAKHSEDPKQSAFVRLYHELPERWGAFERIGVADSGAALYRLPSPMSSSLKN